MRLCRRILLLLLAMLFLVPAGAEEDNLLVNGGFEKTDGDGLPSGWYTGAWVNSPDVTAFSMDESGHTGRAVVIENKQGNDARFAQNVNVEPDTLYRYSGWIRADGLVDSGRGANISIEGVYCFSESVFDSQGEWVHVEMYGRTGPEQTELTVFARVGGYSGLSMGRAAFDDLRLEKVTSLPAGVKSEPWYNVPVDPIEVPAAEEADETASAFWPWLLVLSGVYALMAYLCGRFVTAGNARDLREESAPADKLLLPVMLLVAALLRIIIALNVTGYQVDVNCFISWGMTFSEVGPGAFYTTTGFCDYPPGYLYVMGLNQQVYELFGGALPAAFVHKLIPMACDLLAAALVHCIARQEGFRRIPSVCAATLVAFNPAVVLNSAAWCQVDSVLCLMLMLVAYLAIRGKWSAVLPVYVLAILTKPQALMMGFLGLAAILMALLRELPVFRTKQGKKRIVFPKVWKQMGWGLLWSLLTAAVIVLPAAIGMGGLSWLTDLYGRTLASYPYATVNTANLFYLFGANWRSIQYPADTGVTLVFLLLTAVWCVVTFLRRRDRKVTLLEPAIAVVLVLGLTMTVLGLLPMLSGGNEPYILSTGNPWTVYYREATETAAAGYVREYVPGVEGSWAMPVAPSALLISGVMLLAAAGAMMALVHLRLKDGLQERISWGLIEPALMALFALAFAFMLVFDVSWGTLGTVAMALAFAVVLPMFIRSGKMRMLPLCGAVLFILLYVFGVKMHERYLFPALLLLGMACVLRRDRRLYVLMVALSCTVFINAGIVLDNSIRLGSNMGHLNPDTHSLACLIAGINVALAVWSVWLCQRICAEDAPETTTREPSPLSPVEICGEAPCTPLNYEDAHHVKWDRLDAILIGVVTAVYTLVTFTTLGSTKAPQNAYALTDEHSQVVIDLGAQYDDFTFLYNAQVSYRDFTIETSDDGLLWPADRCYWAQMAEGECFRWKYLTPYYMNGTTRTFYGASDLNGVVHLSGRYVRITAQRQYRYDETYFPIDMQAQEPLVFNELLFRNAAGEAIDARVIGVTSPDMRTLPSYSMRWRITDAQEARMYALYEVQPPTGFPLLDLVAAQCLSLLNAEDGTMVQPSGRIKADGLAARTGLLTPPYTMDVAALRDAAALLDEPDTLDGEPGWWNSTYFDEIYHARTGFEHVTGQDAYEWTHPPLGKVIMSWFISLFGMTPFGWRFAGALCGVMMLPAMYAIAKQLTKKRLMAFAAMFLMAVDCMHFTQTRIATIDSYPVLFIILSYFFMLRFIQRDIVVTPIRKLLPDLALSGFFMGCGVASKWIGIYAGVGLAVLYFWACLRAIRIGIDAARLKRSEREFTQAERALLDQRDEPALRRVVHLCLWCLLFFVAVPLAIYLASYIVHYQARVVDGLLGWLKLIWETQQNMLNYHGTPGMGMDHAYYSPWYEWFTMQTPMYYASPSFTPDGWRYAIYCYGNPIVWYGGLAGLVYVAMRWVRNHRYALQEGGRVWHVQARNWDVAPAFVLIGFAAQILPWVLVPRGTYIYHYFASVPFLILGVVLALDRLSRKAPRTGLLATAAYLGVALAMFIFLFPYASGMLAPTWWMDLIRNYPWTDGWLAKIMEAIPLVPNVW